MTAPEHRPAEEPIEPPQRPYERPAIAWEEDFTPYAFSACGKMSGQGGACNIHANS